MRTRPILTLWERAIAAAVTVPIVLGILWLWLWLSGRPMPEWEKSLPVKATERRMER